MTKCKKCGAETGPAFGLCSACIKAQADKDPKEKYAGVQKLPFDRWIAKPKPRENKS